VADLPGGGAQPPLLIVKAQQYLRDCQADQLGVGDFRRPARPAADRAARGVMRSVSST